MEYSDVFGGPGFEGFEYADVFGGTSDAEDSGIPTPFVPPDEPAAPSPARGIFRNFRSPKAFLDNITQTFTNPTDVQAASLIAGAAGGTPFAMMPLAGQAAFDWGREKGLSAVGGELSLADNYQDLLSLSHSVFNAHTEAGGFPGPGENIIVDRARELAEARGDTEITQNDITNAIADVSQGSGSTGFGGNDSLLQALFPNLSSAGGGGENAIQQLINSGGSGVSIQNSIASATAGINLDQQSLEEALIPVLLEEQGYQLQFDDNGNVIGVEVIEGGLADLRRQSEEGLLERQQLALAGELPIPGLERDLAEREDTLREILRRQIPQGGYKTTSGTADRLEKFLSGADIAKDAARRGFITEGTASAATAFNVNTAGTEATIGTYQSPIRRTQQDLYAKEIENQRRDLELRRLAQQPDYFGSVLSSIGTGAGFGLSNLLFSD